MNPLNGTINSSVATSLIAYEPLPSVMNEPVAVWNEVVKDFLAMIKEKSELSTKILEEDEKTKLMCLSGVKQYPMRVKCATLSWHTLTSAMDGKKKEINTEKFD